jgi:PBSX family phage terminase large subunit
MEVNLSKWQTVVWDDPHRFKVINVGRRSGKSTLSVLKTIDFACNHPGSISWMISPTYKQTKQIAFELFKDYFPHEALEKINETELVFHLKNGSRVLLKGADAPDSLRGVRIDFCVFDEVAFIDKWNEVWKVVRPTLIDSKASCWFISTPNGFNHFKDLYETVSPDYKSFHFTSYDNPYLDKEELDSARETTDEDSFAQEYMGEFRKMSGLIYKIFNRETHMVDIPQIDSNYTFTRELDFGFVHKTALIYFAINSTGDAIYAYDGLYQSDLTIPQIADVVKTKDAGKIITNPVADSARPDSIQELENLGVHFAPVEKFPDSVTTGITQVAELLRIRKDTGKPTLMFNKNLTWIADEFERYRWMQNKSADNVIKETPLKVNDDAMDAIRYFAMTWKKQVSKGSIIDESISLASI